MKKRSNKAGKACIWTKTAIILVRTMFVALASMLTFISLHGLGRI